MAGKALKTGDVVFTADSFAELCDQAMRAPVNPVNQVLWQGHKTGTGAGVSANFNGLTCDLAQVKSTLLGGWPEGSNKVQQAGEKLRLPALKSIRRKVRYGPQGDELDIHAVRNGRLERAWRSAPRQLTSGPVRVHLVINMAANCTVKRDDLPWRGAAGLALAKVLTAAGYGVKITAFSSTMYHDNTQARIFFGATVKEYTQPLNVTALAGAVAHPSSFRRVGFAMICQQSKGQTSSSLGTAYSPTDAELREALRAGDGELLLEVPRETLSLSSAIAWLGTVGDKLGAL